MRILAALVIFALLIAANLFAVMAPVTSVTSLRDPSVLSGVDTGGAGGGKQGEVTATEPSQSSEVSRRSDLANVAERPLFNPARKPAEPAPIGQPVAEAPEPESEPEPEPEPAPPPAAVPDGLALVAIVSDGGKHAALIRVGDAAYARKVVRGDDVDDWTVSTIDPHSMVLENGGTRCAFELGKAAPDSGPCASRRTKE